MEDFIYAVTLVGFCIFLYIKFCYRPKIKTVKAPDKKRIRKQKKRARWIRKVKRRFRIPYRGKTEIVQYDKKRAYLDSVWDEIQGKK